jgi:CRP-like cAMP-binding protein
MTPARLCELPLFADLDEETVENLFDLMLPFRAPAGTVLLAEGEPGDRMHIVREGHLRVSRRLPGGETLTIAEVHDGATLGELSLFLDGRRTATVTALGDTHGWTLGRHAFALLRADSRPAAIVVSRRIGETIVARLRARCETLAARLGDPSESSSTAEVELPPPITDGAIDSEYLASLLCFRRFEGCVQVRNAVAGRVARELQRGDELITQGTSPAALYLVARGAVEVRIVHHGAAERVRLAGPGRFVGHLGVLDEGPSPVAARARERTLLIEFPPADVQRLLAEPRATGRCCATAFYEDAARAVRQADWPTARNEMAKRATPSDANRAEHQQSSKKNRGHAFAGSRTHAQMTPLKLIKTTIGSGAAGGTSSE